MLFVDVLMSLVLYICLNSLLCIHVCIGVACLFNVYVYPLLFFTCMRWRPAPTESTCSVRLQDSPGSLWALNPNEGGPFPGHTELELGLREGGRGEGGLGGLPEPPKKGFDTVVCFVTEL